MKNTFNLIFIILFLGSCQKEKFDLGYYEMTMTWKETIDGETKDFEKTRNLAIVKETSSSIELVEGGVYNSSIVVGKPLTKDGNKISGELPVTTDFTTIEGKKVPFTNTIKGTFNTVIYVTQGPSGAPALKYEYSGKFKMKKQ